MTDQPVSDKRVWIEEQEIPGREVLERVKELAQEQYVQRIVIRNIYDEILVDIPLSVGVFFGGMMMVFAPGLVGLGGLGVLLARVKVQVVKVYDPDGLAPEASVRTLEETGEATRISQRLDEEPIRRRRVRSPKQPQSLEEGSLRESRRVPSYSAEEETEQPQVRVQSRMSNGPRRRRVQAGEESPTEEPRRQTRVRNPFKPQEDEENDSPINLNIPRSYPKMAEEDDAQDETES